MARTLALSSLFLIAGTLYLWSRDGKSGGAKLEVKYRYLVVDIVGPPAWEKKYKFSIRWQGKDVPLPIVFRVPGLAEKFEMQSGGK
jgi:hypothetical protein